jgi:GDP-L-fucose synthase
MKSHKIYIAGHTGLVGSAILELLEKKGYTNLIYKTHEQLDLTNQQKVEDFFTQEKPKYVILAAAKVGGIIANDTFRADFIYQNLQIQNNIIHQSYLHNVKKLIFLGSTCIYPKNSPQPIKEEYLLTDELEYTNEPYAIAKISGIKMCENYNIQYKTNFISLMPTNIYGKNDNFDLQTSHVIPALIRKIHEAKINNIPQVEIWGSGKPKREFLYNDDLADACVFVLENIEFKDLIKDNIDIKNTHINIGTSEDISIKELALLIKDTIQYQGKLNFNTNKPDGTMLKKTNINKISSLGWRYKTSLKKGIKIVYQYYRQTNAQK